MLIDFLLCTTTPRQRRFVLVVSLVFVSFLCGAWQVDAGSPQSPKESSQTNDQQIVTPERSIKNPSLAALGQATATTEAARPTPQSTSVGNAQGEGITEEQLKQTLVGKSLYLRSCYLDASLSFNERGAVTGHPVPGSYTLCGVEIEKVRLGKHKVELLGARYGLHFLGSMPYEDPTKAVDRVKITSSKKPLRITIDREIVVKPKKIKDKHVQERHDKPSVAVASSAATAAQASGALASQQRPETASEAPTQAAQGEGEGQDSAADNAAEAKDVLSAADQLKASIAAASEVEKPADPNSVTTTTSPAHAAHVLREALDKIFAYSLDERMREAMPDFWKLYYQAVATKSDYRPKEPSVLRQNSVDRKARLITNFDPSSNEFAQAAGVAGMALYHVVIGPDGKPGEIAVARPIGFGLDENAADAIRAARFEPALKDGKAVPVLVDLVVQFRIFSKRTAVMDSPSAADKPIKPVSTTPQAPTLPGPYSLQP